MSLVDHAAIASEAGRHRNLLIENSRLIDGTGSPPQDGMSLLISDGRITKIGKRVFSETAERIDAFDFGPAGRLTTRHLASVPGAVYRQDSLRQYALRRVHLRAYLACGVTTVADAALA
jgi:N-acyl-D-aspartate/D-glutamate deacylase